MTFRYRVHLPNIKGFARIYDVDGTNSLYSFHKQMLSDMEFPQDQIVLFKAFDAKGNLVARYATVNLGDGSIEKVHIAAEIEKGVVSYEYFYDTTNKYSVLITLEGEVPSGTGKPALVETKGPNPDAFRNGYVAFEDLPPEKQKHPDDDGFVDDDDDDIDDDQDNDDQDEDFSETFDENEDQES